MKKRALLIGGFQKAMFLSGYLKDRGYQVVVMNASRSNADELADGTGCPVICGDGTLPQTLLNAGMQNADLMLALMSKDEDNLVACVLCKKLLQVRRTVSVLDDMKKAAMFYRSGVDSVICEATAIANALDQEELPDGVAGLVPISGGRVHLMEVPVQEKAVVAGKKIWEIDFPAGIIVGCILRGEQSIVPRGDTRILAGDTLLLIASNKQDILAMRDLYGH